MNRSTLTTAVIFGVTGLLVLYDVWAAFVPGATISEAMLRLGHYHPVIPFALGMLMGHFFWSQQAESTWPRAAAGYDQSGVPPPLTTPRGGKNTLLWLGCATLTLGVILAITDKR